MLPVLKIGQRIEGNLGAYIISNQLHKYIWSATGPNADKFIIKLAPKHLLDNERNVLRHFRGRLGIRQLLDEIQEPQALVLKHLDDNLLSVSHSKILKKSDIKLVAKKILEVLQAFHDDGYVHTGRIVDIKPDNILVDYHNEGPSQFREIELGDCGDVWRVDPKDHLKVGEHGHGIGAAMFRSLEAMLNLRWGAPTDIWFFGTTVRLNPYLTIVHCFSPSSLLLILPLTQLISLIWGLGWHIFKPDPKDAKPDDAIYPMHVLIKQTSFFGPFPLSYTSLIADEDEERWSILGYATNYVQENKKWKPFSLAQDKELSGEDRRFICRIMKLDPRDRPTAKELLQDA
ncbi:MAG: hypothetical protein M1834_007068 [Cirrosporium novae-zelandiae]|nr:MAG: hypothetical protein M1834_007068 [Cirrosporium novae-zelandiae]